MENGLRYVRGTVHNSNHLFICHPPAISTVFPTNRILYFISIGSILNMRSPVFYKPLQAFKKHTPSKLPCKSLYHQPFSYFFKCVLSIHVSHFIETHFLLVQCISIIFKNTKKSSLASLAAKLSSSKKWMKEVFLKAEIAK